MFFFFQAEDGIRDGTVTGVQTCALPISERALGDLKKQGRTVAVSLKETGLHQIAKQLRDRAKLSRFMKIVAQADGCIATTPEAAEIYQSARWSLKRVAFIPTPYPVEDQRWNFCLPPEEQ